MLTRRYRRVQRDAETLTQDGFRAPVEDRNTPQDRPSPYDVIQRTTPPPVTPPMPSSVPMSPPAMESSMAYGRGEMGRYATIGRSLDFADNGDGTLTVARCLNRNLDDLDIQFEAHACPVTAIAPKAFEGCVALRRVVLPQSLKIIGEMAFAGCTGLKRVVVPGQVQRIGTLAFAKCTSLERVQIEPGVQAIGPSCFSKCTALERVDVPSTVTGFGGGVFVGCGKQLCLYGAADAPAQRYAELNGLRFDSEMWRKDELLVYSEQEDGTLVVEGPRNSQTTRVDIPSEICGRRVVAVASRAFYANLSLTQLTIGANVRTMGNHAFFGCHSLKGLSFEYGLEKIEDCAFAGCDELTQVTLPGSVSDVGRMAFFGCKKLSFVKMSPTARIAELAFDGCAPSLRVFGGVGIARG